MTDLVTTASDQGAHDGDEPRLEWAPAPPPTRRRRWPLLLWIGIPLAGVAAAGWYFGTTLIAPGVTVAGVPVGGLTADAAASTISDGIGSTAVEITADGVTATITGADLGASLPAEELAREALAAHPLWQVGGWFPETDRTAPTIDPDATTAALADGFASVWEAPVDAVVAYDDAADLYVVTPAVPGLGVDAAAAEDAYRDALLAAAPGTLSTDLVELEAAITTEAAAARADELNAVLATAGFYVGEERTVAIPADQTASWLTLTPDPEQGRIDLTADEAAIEAAMAGLAEAVNRAPVNATVITDSDGDVIRAETEGQTGRELADTTGMASDYATQLAGGDAVFALPVSETQFETTSLARLLEVDLSDQRVYLKENGAVIDSWLISSGKSGWETNIGYHKVQAKVRVQDMGNDQVGYLQPDVEWVSYFSGDQAFHAVYWHRNWGTPTSHGCVGMPTSLAKVIYDWAPVGTDVWVHA
ncbi:L,D-transpeptidase family protein [Microbacterium sp. NPDC078428]|uniref:L,D-transpeptidase family protein n=1 Tax=Microbacterium sp. NPDC078428 TaxID=3364190 RepID=UPI0037CB4DFC